LEGIASLRTVRALICQHPHFQKLSQAVTDIVNGTKALGEFAKRDLRTFEDHREVAGIWLQSYLQRGEEHTLEWTLSDYTGLELLLLPLKDYADVGRAVELATKGYWTLHHFTDDCDMYIGEVPAPKAA
jgi:hypothetical protein